MRPPIGALSSVNFHVELGLAQQRLVGGDRRLGGALDLGALLEHLLGNRALLHKLLGACEVAAGKSQVGLGLRHIGARLVDGGLERPLVDAEQAFALLDDLTVGEVDMLQIAGHAGANLDGIDRDEAAHIVVLVDHRLRRRVWRP